MLEQIRQFFQQEIGNTAAGKQNQQSLELATAALMIELMKIDGEVLGVEHESMVAALKTQFNVTDHDAKQLVDLADQQVRDATDYYQFTSLINEQFSSIDKLQVLENLWTVAYSDATISPHERQLMRKLADLLHIPHGDHMLAKERARANSNL